MAVQQKYVSSCPNPDCWHADDNCIRLTNDPHPRDERYIEFHELEPCQYCVEGNDE